MTTHLFDTSALLAHYFGETGAQQVTDLLSDPETAPAVCVATVPEFRGRLRYEGAEAAEADRVCGLYFDQLFVCLEIDRRVAECSDRLRERASGRVPLIDALIAACAVSNDAVLVHADAHMSKIVAGPSLLPLR